MIRYKTGCLQAEQQNLILSCVEVLEEFFGHLLEKRMNFMFFMEEW